MTSTIAPRVAAITTLALAAACGGSTTPSTGSNTPAGTGGTSASGGGSPGGSAGAGASGGTTVTVGGMGATGGSQAAGGFPGQGPGGAGGTASAICCHAGPDGVGTPQQYTPPTLPASCAASFTQCDAATCAVPPAKCSGSGGAGGAPPATCASDCAALDALKCPADVPGKCLKGCQDALAFAAQNGCAATFQTVIACVGTSPAACSPSSGVATPSGCGPEEAAFNQCINGGAGGAGGAAGSGTVGGGGAPPIPPVPCSSDPLCVVPPGPTSGAPPAQGTAPRVLAISTLRVGDADPQGNQTANAWQGYGFNIDGLHFTSSKSLEHCVPQSGAKPADVVLDGVGGVDNSFGKNIVPILLGLASDLPQQVQAGIDTGLGTEVLSLDGLDDVTDEIAMKASFAAVTGVDGGMGGVIAPPAGDWSAYAWRPFANTPPSPFDTSYLTKNTWVSGSATATIAFTLSFSGYDLPLTIHLARMTLPLAVDHASGKGGKIGGVLVTEELAAAIKAIAGKVSPSLCQGSALDGVLAQIRQGSDIMVDGTQTPGATCDGVSIGLGFDAKRAQLATTPAPKVTPKDPCAP